MTVVNQIHAIAMIILVYIGSKVEKRDNVAGTNIVWFGYGDAQPVPAAQARLLLRHPGVWMTEEQFKANPPPPPVIEKPVAQVEMPDAYFDLREGAASVTPEAVSTGPASIDEVKAAILSLDADNPEHFSEAGKPLLKAVRSVIAGKDVPVKLLNAAWEDVSAVRGH